MSDIKWEDGEEPEGDTEPGSDWGDLPDIPAKYVESGTYCFVSTYFSVYPDRPEELLFVTVNSSLERAMKAKLLVATKEAPTNDIPVSPEWEEPVYSNGEFLSCNGNLRYTNEDSVRAVILQEYIN